MNITTVIERRRAHDVRLEYAKIVINKQKGLKMSEIGGETHDKAVYIVKCKDPFEHGTSVRGKSDNKIAMDMQSINHLAAKYLPVFRRRVD